MNGKKEYGDYQTPFDFARKICIFLKNYKNINPNIILEPTCGIGNFLEASQIFNAKKSYGIEINKTYCNKCEEKFKDKNIEIINSDFFLFDFSKIRNIEDDILIIGNPPWVNNSTLSVLKSKNLPDKVNFKGLKGIEAMTGMSNFDICEYIILELVNLYCNTNTMIAMLCKTSVAINIFKELKRKNIFFEFCEIIEFNANEVFNISVSACLLVIKLSNKCISVNYCNIYDFNDINNIKSCIGFKDKNFYSNLMNDIDKFDGKCCFEWRQGVKHDCAKIMELNYVDDKFINGNKEKVEIEESLIYPLIKSSMFKKPIINNFSKYVIVTQKKIKQDTAYIKYSLPKTWDYLQSNKVFFDKRKSSIYCKAPDFSMFGVGDYSYARYKVGVSGFYKEPLFSILYSENEKPVMTDDTSYFICFSSYNYAYVAMLYLNSIRVQNFLKSIAFIGAKRPYTKKVLERLDFKKIINEISYNELYETEKKLGLEPYLNKSIIDNFRFIPELQ